MASHGLSQKMGIVRQVVKVFAAVLSVMMMKKAAAKEASIADDDCMGVFWSGVQFGMVLSCALLGLFVATCGLMWWMCGCPTHKRHGKHSRGLPQAAADRTGLPQAAVEKKKKNKSSMKARCVETVWLTEHSKVFHISEGCGALAHARYSSRQLCDRCPVLDDAGRDD